MDDELASPGVLCSLSTEELLTKIQEWGLDVTEGEAQRFRDNEVDGDTVDCGLTETMVAYLFQGSFKKQVKFNQFVSRMKESSVTLTLQTVSPEDWQPSTSSTSIRYPTNSEYVQAVKTLVMKYPFLKDREGNGYHTWHMSLRRKFKSERAPLVDSEAVRRCKEKFGSTRRGQPNKCQRTSQRNVCQGPCVQGEDLLSIDAHLKVLQCQYQKMQPDTMVVHNRMQQTFAWRQKEIADGMPVEDVLKKYPFLGMPTGTDRSDKIINMGPRMSGNREALKVTSRMLGGGSDPGADVTSRNELTDGPTHRDPPEGISKKLEGRVGFQMAQKQGGVCSDHALLTTFGGNVKPTCRDTEYPSPGSGSSWWSLMDLRIGWVWNQIG
ncbi:uncharacterized protein LOC143418705 [Maylandia zebra]|uniref:uncharacterized protein LOC143418705 n=1 Tax=Maylandia zebra TaxID=106582 RepID=UPI00403C04A3